MPEYTKEILKDLSRVKLRRAAIEVLEIDNKEASNSKSSDLIERIVEAQGGGGKKKASKSNGASTRSGRTRTKREAAPEPEPEQEAADDQEVDESDVGEKVDALGASQDENQEELVKLIGELRDEQIETQRQLFMLNGLLNDVYTFLGEPDDLQERIKELKEEWASEGN